MANTNGKQECYANNGYGVVKAPKQPVKDSVSSTKKTGSDLRSKG